MGWPVVLMLNIPKLKVRSIHSTKAFSVLLTWWYSIYIVLSTIFYYLYSSSHIIKHWWLVKLVANLKSVNKAANDLYVTNKLPAKLNIAFKLTTS